MLKTTRQTNYFIAFIAVALLLGGAAYLQIYMGVNPCPLCLLQRFTLGALGAVFLLGVVCSSKACGRWITGLLSLIVSSAGIILSGRQVWLQYYPAQTGENCEASLQYLLSAFPLDQVIKKIFVGGTECSRVDWQFMHVSLAQWSFICFIFFLLFSFWQLFFAATRR